MTPEEKEIRAADRKAMAEVRSWKRKAQKLLDPMTLEEREEHFKKLVEEFKAKGINIPGSVK